MCLKDFIDLNLLNDYTYYALTVDNSHHIKIHILNYAVGKCAISIVEYLLREGGFHLQENAYDLIYLAVSSYHYDERLFQVVKLLLQVCDIKCISQLSQLSQLRDANDCDLLFHPIIATNIKTTGLLIHHGANIHDNKIYDSDFYIRYLITNYAEEEDRTMNDSFVNHGGRYLQMLGLLVINGWMEMCAYSYTDNEIIETMDDALIEHKSIMSRMRDDTLECIELNTTIRNNHIDECLANILPTCICEMIIAYICIV